MSALPTICIARAQGSRLWSDDGREYVDFTSQGGLLALGHADPVLACAAREQIAALAVAHGAFQFDTTIDVGGRTLRVSRDRTARALLACARELDPDYEHCLFNVSGSAALATALAAARMSVAWSDAPPAEKDALFGEHRPFPQFAVLAFHESYHGQLGDAAQLTDGRLGFAMGMTPSIDVIRIDFPREGMECIERDRLVARVRRQVDLARQRYGWRLAGFVFEPIGGTGRVPDGAALRAIVDIMRSQRLLVIADEIKTAFGRTGRYFACQHEGIKPDILVLAKALAGGRPAGAVLVAARTGFGSVPSPAEWNWGTFIAEPVACAVMLAFLDRVRELDLPGRAARAGEALKEALDFASRRVPGTHARGRGLLQGLEFECESLRDDILAACRNEGLLVSASGRGWGTPTLLLAPPLVVSDDELADGLSRFERAVTSVLTND